jgi:cytoskeletal protein CcmA (bactofilin family)
VSPRERATIGRSITIRGEVTGDEDLLIQGRGEGSVDLKQHAVTVGSEGEVKADIVARVVTVEGKVDGNLTAEEQVVLRGSARVQGDISAPRIMLEDGAYFRGGVDMGESAGRSAARPAARAYDHAKAGADKTGSGAQNTSGATEDAKSGSQSAAQVTT